MNSQKKEILQELNDFESLGQQAEEDNQPQQARRYFLEAAQLALTLSQMESDDIRKRATLDRAISFKKRAKNLASPPEKESPPAPSPSPKEVPEEEETSHPAPETSSSKETPSNQSSEAPTEPTNDEPREVVPEDEREEDLAPGDLEREKAQKAWEEGDLKQARRLYLKAAEGYALRAQKLPESSPAKKELVDNLFEVKGKAQELKAEIEGTSPADLLVQEGEEQAELGDQARKDGDEKRARIHYLKGAEAFLKLTEDKNNPHREKYYRQGLELRDKAKNLGSQRSSENSGSSTPQPMRMENLLKRAEKFERRGLDARDDGNRDKAIHYLRQAAEMFEELATRSTDRLSVVRRERAEKLYDIVKKLEGRSSKSRTKQAEKDAEADSSVFVPVEKPAFTFADIAGLDNVKDEVRRKMLLPFEFPEQAERFGIKKGGGILLYGPPGTGKTMIAQAIAAEIDAAFFCVRPSEIMSKWVGEAEKNIEVLFETAHKQPRSIIFIDEIEALVPSRRDNQSNVMQRLVPQILAELEGFGGTTKNPLLFLGATNEPWSLDPAVLRPGRFDDKIYVSLPDPDAIRELLRINFDGKPLDEDVDLDELASLMESKNYSGADIKNICLKAATDAFVLAVHNENPDEASISRNQVLKVMRKVKPSVTKDDLARFDEYAQEH